MRFTLTVTLAAYTLISSIDLILSIIFFDNQHSFMLKGLYMALPYLTQDTLQPQHLHQTTCQTQQNELQTQDPLCVTNTYHSIVRENIQNDCLPDVEQPHSCLQEMSGNALDTHTLSDTGEFIITHTPSRSFEAPDLPYSEDNLEYQKETPNYGKYLRGGFIHRINQRRNTPS